MSKHTPGPYLRDERFVYASTMFALPSGKPMEVNRFSASVSPGHECSRAEAEAVARLFCAAPDLLEALRNLSAIVDAAIRSGDWKVDGACDPDMDIAAARAAIAKARGDA